MRAQEVLNDCKECYWDLKDSLEKNDLQQIRIKWITCLTFLRMVGHVLTKIDQRNYPNKEQIFSELFEERKEDDIFKNFIEKERNMALKEYEITVEPNQVQVETEVGMLFQDGSRFLTQSGDYLIYEGTTAAIHFSSKKDKVENEERLDWWINEAINWWESYLRQLKEKLKVT